MWLRKVITLTHQWYRDIGDFLGNWTLALIQLQRLLKSIIGASTVSSWMWHAVQLKHALIRMLSEIWLTSRPYYSPLLMVTRQTVSLWIGLSLISKMTSTEHSYDSNLTCCQIWWRPIQNITPWQDALQLYPIHIATVGVKGLKHQCDSFILFYHAVSRLLCVSDTRFNHCQTWHQTISLAF